MNLLTPEIWKKRHSLLKAVRTFFHGKGFLEVNTPILNPWSTPEPFLHPFYAGLPGEDQGGEHSLITSPEFNLKKIWASLDCNIFEIAHSFRSQESGPLHTPEFLMLEWYHKGIEEKQCILFIQELIHSLILVLQEEHGNGSSRGESGGRPQKEVPGPGEEKDPAREASSPTGGMKLPDLEVYEVQELFGSTLNIGLDYRDLQNLCLKRGHFSNDAGRQRRYEEYFFTLFLNYIEPQLPGHRIVALKDYPVELAAYSRVESGRARRFEIYWKGLELANGYLELDNPEQQKHRMEEERALKEELTGRRVILDEQLIRCMESPGLPFGCGVALGLERLLMALLDADTIQSVSPFPAIPAAPE